MNKRGQDLSIGTLILIVLGIVVLVLLILGFSLGWQNLFEKINIFSSGSGLDSVVSSCELSVASNSKASYCSDFKKVKIDGDTEYISCEDERIQSSLSGAIDCDGNALDRVMVQCFKLIKDRYDTTQVSEGTLLSIDNQNKCRDYFRNNLLVNEKSCSEFCSSDLSSTVSDGRS